ncbi:hypothetical protein KZ483_15610 [Paenibacillus sp. sptzw28]|uniref:hypothetical protein n=1 Tax=Paenibacillus sp. sptzw28 TaxID=715179 RepID=UPI001C6EDF67|nr:hypothetical protein [Paenibacillus sp. sptzw28]QYR19357.1 hypothetical protein KZ483_15610 [Paenibacillus sp. sptzw28]
MNENSQENPELRDLSTHMAGDVRLHETRTTARPMKIEPGRKPGQVSQGNDRPKS